jgi:hypothetical protein
LTLRSKASIFKALKINVSIDYESAHTFILVILPYLYHPLNSLRILLQDRFQLPQILSKFPKTAQFHPSGAFYQIASCQLKIIELVLDPKVDFSDILFFAFLGRNGWRERGWG